MSPIICAYSQAALVLRTLSTPEEGGGYKRVQGINGDGRRLVNT